MDDIERRIHERYRALESEEGTFGQFKKSETIIKMTTQSERKTNKITDLREQLFDTIQQLKKGEIDIQKAQAIANVAQVVVNSVKVEVDFLKTVNGKDSYFFPNKQIE